MDPTDLTPEKALVALRRKSGQEFVELLRRGTLSVEFYKPEKVDKQQPHDRDEVYVIVSGSGFFVNGDVRHRFEAGQVLFVPAGRPHRFEDFTDDFATWVLFYGPVGGEREHE